MPALYFLWPFFKLFLLLSWNSVQSRLLTIDKHRNKHTNNQNLNTWVIILHVSDKQSHVLSLPWSSTVILTPGALSHAGILHGMTACATTCPGNKLPQKTIINQLAEDVEKIWKTGDGCPKSKSIIRTHFENHVYATYQKYRRGDTIPRIKLK